MLYTYLIFYVVLGLALSICRWITIHQVYTTEKVANFARCQCQIIECLGKTYSYRNTPRWLKEISVSSGIVAFIVIKTEYCYSRFGLCTTLSLGLWRWSHRHRCIGQMWSSVLEIIQQEIIPLDLLIVARSNQLHDQSNAIWSFRQKLTHFVIVIWDPFH